MHLQIIHILTFFLSFFLSCLDTLSSLERLRVYTIIFASSWTPNGPAAVLHDPSTEDHQKRKIIGARNHIYSTLNQNRTGQDKPWEAMWHHTVCFSLSYSQRSDVWVSDVWWCNANLSVAFVLDVWKGAEAMQRWTRLLPSGLTTLTSSNSLISLLCARVKSIWARSCHISCLLYLWHFKPLKVLHVLRWLENQWGKTSFKMCVNLGSDVLKVQSERNGAWKHIASLNHWVQFKAYNRLQYSTLFSPILFVRISLPPSTSPNCCYKAVCLLKNMKYYDYPPPTLWHSKADLTLAMHNFRLYNYRNDNTIWSDKTKYKQWYLL